MLLVSKTSNTVVSENLVVADTFFKRLKGLMFTKELAAQDALHIIPCNEIHTFFMNYSIDVLYLDKGMNIVRIDEDMVPGKIGKKAKTAISVVELTSGTVKAAGLKVGQTVEFVQR